MRRVSRGAVPIVASALLMTGFGNDAAVAVNCSRWCVPPLAATTVVSPTYLGHFPQLLFRVDTTPPTGEHGAFFDGIDSLGMGTSLVDHVLGSPPLGNQHAFVGTTANALVALVRARGILAAGHRVWIYTVYPNENYFNVEQSLYFIRANADNEADRMRAELAIAAAAGLEEWVALGPIFPSEIAEAREITDSINPDSDFGGHAVLEIEVNTNADPLGASDHPSSMLLTA